MRKRMTAGLLAAAIALAAGPAAGEAEKFHGVLETPKTLVERGFFIGPDFGLLFLVANDTSLSSVGFITGLTMGYDVWKYVSLLAMSDFAIFQAGRDLEGGVTMFLINGGAKGQYPVTPRLWPYVRMLGGYFFTDPDISSSTATSGGVPIFAGVPKETMDLMFGGGLTYYMAKRHFSLDLGFDYVYIKDVPFDAINLNVSLRYTF